MQEELQKNYTQLEQLVDTKRYFSVEYQIQKNSDDITKPIVSVQVYGFFKDTPITSRSATFEEAIEKWKEERDNIVPPAKIISEEDEPRTPEQEEQMIEQINNDRELEKEQE